MRKIFDQTGFTAPGFSFTNIDAAKTEFNKIKALGGTSVIVDYHLQNGSLVGNDVTVDKYSMSLDQLSDVLQAAKSSGLIVWLKPILLVGDTAVSGNDALRWAEMKPSSPENWFENYGKMLARLASIAEKSKVDYLLLTNELQSMTTKASFKDLWANLISNIKNQFHGQVGFNARASLDRPMESDEFYNIVNYDDVDFIGLSSYFALTPDYSASPEDQRLGWYNNVYSVDIKNSLDKFVDRVGSKPIFFTEFGSPAFFTGNTLYPDTNNNSLMESLDFDLEGHKRWFDNSLSFVAKAFSEHVEGIFLYHWEIGTPLDQRHKLSAAWDFRDKPALDVVSKWFKATTNDISTGLNETGTLISEQRRGGQFDDTLKGGLGSDTVIGGMGNDVLIGGPPSLTADSPPFTLSISVSGDILDGIAPSFSIFINGSKVTTIQMSPIQAGTNPNFGNLPFTGTQSFLTPINIQEISSIAISHNNDQYRGLGFDRNLLVQSLAVDGVSADKATSSYLRDDGVAESGTWQLYQGGTLSFGVGEIRMQTQDTKLDQDFIQAGEGDDSVTGGIGNDFIDGGQGNDIAVFAGVRNQYLVSLKSGDALTVSDLQSNRDGVDTIQSVERLKFLDQVVSFDPKSTPGKAYRVYKAAFNRDPMEGDKAGLGYWIGQIDKGMDLIEVSARFVDSKEFRDLYGTNPTNAQFLTKLYENVLGRTPEATGYNWWLNELNTNPSKTKAKVLADFSESGENQNGVASLIGNGIAYEPWVG